MPREPGPAYRRQVRRLLTRAYALGEEAGVKNMLRNRGLAPIERQDEAEHILVRRYRRFPELKGVELDP